MEYGLVAHNFQGEEVGDTSLAPVPLLTKALSLALVRNVLDVYEVLDLYLLTLTTDDVMFTSCAVWFSCQGM